MDYVFSVFFVCLDLTLCCPLYGTTGSHSSRQCQDTCSACSLFVPYLAHQGLSAQLLSQVWPCYKYFTFSNFFAVLLQFQQNLEALQPLPSSSMRTFSKLTLPLILSLRFLAEVGNKDVTASGGLARLGYPLASAYWRRKEGHTRLQVWPSRKPCINLLQHAHREEWGVQGGKWLPWRCLYNWGRLTQSLAGAFSSPHCLWAFLLSSSQSLLWHTDSNERDT